jgi:WD40 repeat protein
VGWVRDVNFSADSSYIVSVGDDGMGKLWNLSGEKISEFKGHLGGVLKVRFAPDDKFIATGGTDGTARLWRLSEINRHSRELLNTITSSSSVTEKDPRCSLLYAPGLYPERVFSTLFDDNRVGRIQLENQAGKSISVKLYHPDYPGSAWGSFQINPDDQWIFPSSQDNYGFGSDWGIQIDDSQICILGRIGDWSSPSNESMHIFRTTSNRFPGGTSFANQNIVNGLDLSPVTQRIATGELNGTVRILNIEQCH